MKVLSYNIYEGACGSGADRLDDVLAVIRTYDPDILGLCECRGFLQEERNRLDRVTAALGMCAIINKANSGNHVALLYRSSVKVVSEEASCVSMYHGFSSMVISTEEVGRVAIVMTHLHPRSVIFRMAEAQNILAKATFEPNALVMGDFNSLSSHEDASVVSSLSLNGKIRLKEDTGDMPTDVASLFTKYGFADLGAPDRKPTYPTRLVTEQGSDREMMRLDYMLATSEISKRAKMMTIESAEAHAASDHLPIACELVI